MDLAQLISELHSRGNLMASWSGVETNVESVSDIIGSNGKFSIELKLKQEPINEEELDRIAEEEFPIRVFYNYYGEALGQDNRCKEKEAFKLGYRKAKGE